MTSTKRRISIKRVLDLVSITYDDHALKEFEKHLDEIPRMKSYILDHLKTIDVDLDLFGRYIFAIEAKSKACFLLKRDRNFEAFEGIVDPYICKYSCYNDMFEDNTINCLIAIRSKCSSLIFQAKERYQVKMLDRAGYECYCLAGNSLIFTSTNTDIGRAMQGRSFIVTEKIEK